MATGGDLDDSSSSGDVIIDHWSEGEDDVICIDYSSEETPKKSDTENNHAGSDSDSDDCVILENEVMVTKKHQQKVAPAPPPLQCESFEDFKRESEELLTSTPKHEVDEDTYANIVSEDEDDSGSSDDNLEIIADTTPNDQDHADNEVPNDEINMMTTNEQVMPIEDKENVIARESAVELHISKNTDYVPLEENNNLDQCGNGPVGSSDESRNTIDGQVKKLIDGKIKQVLSSNANIVSVKVDGVTKGANISTAGPAPAVKKSTFVFGRKLENKNDDLCWRALDMNTMGMLRVVDTIDAVQKDADSKGVKGAVNNENNNEGERSHGQSAHRVPAAKNSGFLFGRKLEDSKDGLDVNSFNRTSGDVIKETVKKVENVVNTNISQNNKREGGTVSVAAPKKHCTAVVLQTGVPVLDTVVLTALSGKEEVPMSDQLAMSEEEEEDEGKDGEYWLKMIAGSSVESPNASNQVEVSAGIVDGATQAWSGGEEDVDETVVKKSSSGNKKKVKSAEMNEKVKAASDNEDDEDKISLAPSLEMFSDNNDEDKEKDMISKDEDVDDSDDDLHLAIYSLGNYCKRMVRGVLCSKPRCSWVHYMFPADAVTQFYRICSNRSAKAVFRFYRFFTNLEIQAQMVVDAQELLAKTDPGEEIDIDPKQVCREVFKAMVRVSKGLDLSIDQYMEMVEISSSLYTIKDGRDTLVSLFHQTCGLLADTGAHPAGPRLVRWSWTSLYLNSLSNGVVLSAQFYLDICTLLANQKMIPQLVVVLLYTVLVPSLSTPLVPLAEVLTSPPTVLTNPHTTAIFTAQTLSRLSSTEWLALSKLGDIKPGIIMLVQVLKTDNPAEVYKFFASLPELPGLNIPDIPLPALTSLDCWLRQKMAEGRWEEVAYHFCSIDQQEVETISEFAEKILLEVSQLCGEFKLLDPIPALYSLMLPVVMRRECEVHTQFFRQLGVAFVVCQVTSSQWEEAGALVKMLASQLSTDFLAIKPPALRQFSELDKGMVPLFVLEVLVWTTQRTELIKYLELWDCLASLEAEVELEKRNTIMTSVLECLAMGNTDTVTVDMMIRVSDVMVLGMRAETNVILRKRQEVMSNILVQLILNENLSGSRLWSRYQMVRSCNHQLQKPETRGIVYMLAYARMLPQARKVYQEAVKWGVYSVQAVSRPLTLRLLSCMTLEEIFVILTEFLDRVEAEAAHLQESLNIFVKMEVTSSPKTGIKHLNCVSRSSREDAMRRVDNVLKMLEPPLVVTQASVPYVSEDLVRTYFVSKQRV